MAEIDTQAQALRSVIDKVFTGLDAKSREVLTALRGCTVVKAHALNADEAMAAGISSTAWGTYTGLRSAYHEVYAVASTLISNGACDINPAEYHRAGFELTRLANADEVWPDRIAGIASGARGNAPWQRFNGTIAQPGDTEAFLTWLIRTTDAQPIVLHPDQLPAAYAATRAKVDAHKSGTPIPA